MQLPKRVSYVFVLLILILPPHLSKCQGYQLQRVYICNFIRYVQWPAEKQTRDFVIGVFGKCPLLNELNTFVANRSVGTPKIIANEISNVADAEACQVLFVPTNKNDFFSGLKEALSGKSTLWITEKEGLGKQGSSINFVIIDGVFKYELNKGGVDKAVLKALPDLESSAILVES